jgi:uncharacterized protein YwqG
MMTRSELRARLDQVGLAHVADQLAKLAQPCIQIEPTRSEDSSIPVGTSKFGGCPDLPAGVQWPHWQDKPLSFLTQLNLDTLPQVSLFDALSASGHLLFFYETKAQTWGFDPHDKGSWRVVYTEEPNEKLERRETPKGAETFAACTLSFRASFSLPSPQSEEVQALGLKYGETESYEEARACDFETNISDSEATERIMGCRHQLLGYSHEIQNEMRTESQFASNGIYCGGASRFEDSERLLELKREVTQWQLLLQIDSDDDVGWMWGDLGRLYFWIRGSDLAAKEFSNVWMILQCS